MGKKNSKYTPLPSPCVKYRYIIFCPIPEYGECNVKISDYSYNSQQLALDAAKNWLESNCSAALNGLEIRIEEKEF